MIGFELLGLTKLRGVEKRGPVDSRSLLLEIGARPDEGALGEVLALLARRMIDWGDGSLKNIAVSANIGNIRAC